MKNPLVIQQQQSLSVTNIFLDKIAFTLPISLTGIGCIVDRAEKAFQSKKFQFVRTNRKGSVYGNIILLYNDKKSLATISYGNKPNMQANGFSLEYNPAKITTKDSKLLVNVLKYLLKDDYSLIWERANITRMDATFDVYGCIPDHVVVFHDGSDLKGLTFDGEYGLLSQKHGSEKSNQYLVVYNKSGGGNQVSRFEIRMKVQKLACFKKEPVIGIKNAKDVLIHNPYSGLMVYSNQFVHDKRFAPGFYDCIRIRGLVGALSHYRNHDSRLAEQYFNILNADYTMEVFDSTAIWEGAGDCVNCLDIFQD
ncbi:MAG: hypothetical protein U1F12_08910 [Pseudomonadales bacterium]|jgi:hypothetical protein